MPQTRDLVADRAGPAFLDHRWAACENPRCRMFHNYRRERTPLACCRMCLGKLRTTKWTGWDKLKRKR